MLLNQMTVVIYYLQINSIQYIGDMSGLIKMGTSIIGKKEGAVQEENKEEGKGNPPGESAAADVPASQGAGAANQEEAKMEGGTMKAGDYVIHVFIEQAKNIKVEDGATLSPLFEVSVLNEKKFTTAKDKITGTSVASWNEHLFFEPKNVSVNAIEEAKISVRMLDKGYFKQALIGHYEFDVSWVYFQPKKSIMHKWIVLSNPESQSFNEVTAYLKLSISVATVGDEQIQITEDTGGDSDSILMPPSIQPKYYQIRFKFYKAEHLPAMDQNLFQKQGSIDAYISAQYMSFKLNTPVHTVKQGEAAVFNTEFLIPCQIPLMSTRVVIKIMDKDIVGKDEVVGSILFDLKDCIDDPQIRGKSQKNLNGKLIWKNVYGSPLGCKGANTDLMNSNPDLASNWKGRVLMSVESQQTDKPVCQMRPIKEKKEENKKEGAVPENIKQENRKFEFFAEVGQGFALPSEDKYRVKIKIAEQEFMTDDPAYNMGQYNRWKQILKPKDDYLELPYENVEDIGKVFIYLMKGNDAICYYAANVTDFLEPNPQFKWLELLPDLAVGKVKESHKAGLISVRMYFKDMLKPVKDPSYMKQEPVQEVKNKKKRMNVKIVHAYIFQCRDLPSADADGQSDPFIQIWDTSKTVQKTKVIMDNNNPLFYEPLKLTMEVDQLEQMTPIIIDIYDHDTLSNDFICRSVVNFDEAIFKNEKYIEDNKGNFIPEPKWQPCRITPNSPNQGEILVSFNIVEFDYDFNPSAKDIRNMVQRSEYEIEINVLGLRDLQSTGILPVKKPYIVFHLKSLLPPDDGRAIENKQTQPNSFGSNPTINTLINFSIPFPEKEIYHPRLLCTVHDFVLKATGRDLLGSFVIPVGGLIKQLCDERNRETKALGDIVNQLMEIIEGRGIPTYNRRGSAAANNKQLIQDPSNSEYTETVASQYEIREEEFKLQVDKDLVRKSIKGGGAGMDSSKRPLLIPSDDEEAFGGQAELDQVETDVTALLSNHREKPKQVQEQASRQRQGTIKNVLKSGAGENQLSAKEKEELLKKEREQKEKNQRELENKRMRDEQDLKGKLGEDSAKNVILAKYGLDRRLKVEKEINIPPATLFLGLGFDPSPNAGERHYRRFYPKELELVKEVMSQESPFNSFELKRGQSRGASKNWWQMGKATKMDASGQVTSEQVVGKFKGVVTVQTIQAKKDYAQQKMKLLQTLNGLLNTLSQKKLNKRFVLDPVQLDTMEGRKKLEMEFEKMDVGHLNITQSLADIESDETLRRLLMSQNKCIVRVYVIDAFNLSSRDNGGESDPYLLISMGNKIYNDRDNYQTDQPNPKFYKSFDFESVFPGCAPLQIKLMDYDALFGDEVIGTTQIDLEDRFFSPEWQSIEDKPIELRPLYHPTSSIAQGTVRLWVEIHPLNAGPMSQVKQWKIEPAPPKEFEVRLCIFNTVDVPADDPEGVSDIYITAAIDSLKESKSTDTHYRAQKGVSSFNFRMLFNHTYPRADPNDYNLSLQIYDRDILTSNDIIGEATINIKELVEDAFLTDKPVYMTKQHFDSYLNKDHKKKFEALNIKFEDKSTFWIEAKKKNSLGALKPAGKVRIQIDVLPKKQADSNKVGEARQDPNHSPFLKPPEGRLELSMNPLKMVSQMIGPELRSKIIRWFICGSCIALCVMLLPLVAGNLISALIMSIFESKGK